MITPYPYQVQPIDVLTRALANNMSALDASDTGVGKTIHALLAAKLVARPVAVICPKSVIPAWRDLAGQAGVKVLFIANIEKLKAQKRGPLRKEGSYYQWVLPHDVVLIFDEVHRFSAPNTQNAKILAFAPRPVLMLSATSASDPTKMRAIGQQLGLTTWRDWWNWCGRNGCRKGYWGGIEFKGTSTDLDRIHRQIFNTGRGVRVRIKDLGDQFPQIRLETASVPVEDRRAVDEAYLDELRALEAKADPLEAQIRARQISEHQKIAPVIELIEDLVQEGNAVAMFVNFRDTLKRFAEGLRSYPCAQIHGDQTDEEREFHINSFQSNKSTILLSMIQAGGVGINLPDLDGFHPRVSLLFPGWNPVDMRQASRRAHRVTSKSPCTVKFLFADGTIEDRIRRKVDKKLANIDLLNDGDLNAE